MPPLRVLLVGLALLSASLAAACGPHAFPTRGPASTSPVATGSQLFGGNQLEGRLLFVKDGSVWMWENGTARAMTEGDTWRQPRWSPDGKKLAYVLRGNSFSDILVTDLQGTSQTRLTRSQSRILDDNDWNFHPAWSPDGKQIAFATDSASTNLTLWVMNAADGSGRRQVATPGVLQEAVDSLAWSPDGSQLAVALFSGGASEIALVPMGGTGRQQARVLTDDPGGALDPAWSPDGQWIAYAARHGGGVEIFAMRADGTGRQQLTSTGNARAPAWSPDGRHVAYLSAQSGAFEVWAVDVQLGSSGRLDVSNDRQLTRDLALDATSGISWAR